MQHLYPASWLYLTDHCCIRSMFVKHHFVAIVVCLFIVAVFYYYYIIIIIIIIAIIYYIIIIIFNWYKLDCKFFAELCKFFQFPVKC